MSNLLIPPTGQIKTLSIRQKDSPPPLQAGDHLMRAEFERRYLNHPEIKKAELLEGVVYMSSPVRIQEHSEPHFDLIVWLGAYKAATKGLRSGDNGTVKLDNKNEVQPDIFVYLPKSAGGQAEVGEDGYLQGAPEFIVEIAASSASYDMHVKKRVYARHRVREYLVVQMYEQKLDWFVWREGKYEPLLSGEDGIWRSELFPGLWLNAAAFWNNDLATMLQTLQQGLATPEHTTFASHLFASEN